MRFGITLQLSALHNVYLFALRSGLELDGGGHAKHQIERNVPKGYVVDRSIREFAFSDQVNGLQESGSLRYLMGGVDIVGDRSGRETSWGERKREEWGR